MAFLGRSNVGKSSLLNRLLRGKELARTSAKPGCTQWINFYRAEDGLLFVDLPGYGFAKAPPDRRRGWQALVESYLLHRKSLHLSFLLLDARRGWMDNDLELKEWLKYHQLRYQVIATKFDKLKTQRDRNQCLAAIRSRLALDDTPVMFSAVTGQGVSEIWQAIRSIKTNP